jgi:hypothetical protein
MGRAYMKGPLVLEQKVGVRFFSALFPYSWRTLLFFDLFLLAVLIIATRLATFLHELIGHALMASAFGGEVNGVRMSLFGGGHVYYLLSRESGLLVRLLVAFGGIIVNMLSGLLLFIFIRKPGKRSGWAFFPILFGMVSLLGAVAYCALGFYYDHGDPVAWADRASPQGGWLSIPFLVVSPFVSYFAVKAYSIINEAWFPTKTYLGRVVMLVLTLGLIGGAYAGLFGLTDQRSVALDAPLSAYKRAEEEVIKRKVEELFRRLRESHPELSETEIQRLVERTPIVVNPDEVPKKFPLKPVIAILYAAGALMALRGVREGVPDSHPGVDTRSFIMAVALAGAALGALVMTGGWIYRSANWLP